MTTPLLLKQVIEIVFSFIISIILSYVVQGVVVGSIGVLMWMFLIGDHPAPFYAGATLAIVAFITSIVVFMKTLHMLLWFFLQRKTVV